jgi:hypothetical protein
MFWAFLDQGESPFSPFLKIFTEKTKILKF